MGLDSTRATDLELRRWVRGIDLDLAPATDLGLVQDLWLVETLALWWVQEMVPDLVQGTG